MPTVSFPGLLKKRNVWFARMIVPADVQPILGRRVLVKTTGETDVTRAAQVARPILEGWRRDIDAARRGSLTALQAQVADLAKAYRAAKGTDDAPLVLEDALEFVARRLVGVHPDDLAQRAQDYADGDRYAALGSLQGGDRAQLVLDTITGDRTPLMVRYDAWSATLPALLKTSRQVDVYRRMVREIDRELGHPCIEDITRQVLHAWVEDSVLVRGIAPKTLTNRLQALRHYWRHLVGHGHAEDDQPFQGLRVPRVAQGARVVRKAFDVTDVYKLVEASTGTLRTLIILGALTGARIAELVNLRWDDVDLQLGTIRIVDSKTTAGLRVIPIVPALGALLASLDRQDDHVLPGLPINAHGERGAALGPTFSKLKARLGYGPEVVFHSLRKLVATLLEDAQVPEGVAADILGHEKPTMTYGLYSGGASLEVKAGALRKALGSLGSLGRATP